MFSSDQQIFHGLSIHVNNQRHPQAAPPNSSASLKQRHPQEVLPSSSAALKHASIGLGIQLTHSSIWLRDHAKMNTNMKTTNETATRRWTQSQKWQTRWLHKDKENDERDTHSKTNTNTILTENTPKRRWTQPHRNSTQQHQITKQIMAPASSQRVLMNQGACQNTKGANVT